MKFKKLNLQIKKLENLIIYLNIYSKKYKNIIKNKYKINFFVNTKK